jgi:hypothetical protein
MWKWGKKKSVRVTFVDAESGATLARSDIKPEQLPESFEADTMLDLQGQKWRVTAAEPMTRAEYVQSGELLLTLGKLDIAEIPPGDLLYSLPTICDGIPGVASNSTKLGKSVLELHEDDWRQTELISIALAEEIDIGFAYIRRIYDEERTPIGVFKKIHVRKEVPVPLVGCELRVAQLQLALGREAVRLDGLSYQGVAGLIDGGFAFATPSALRIYGIEREGVATTIGLLTHGLSGSVDAQTISRLMKDHGLLLVDWCALRQIRHSDNVVAYFTEMI